MSDVTRLLDAVESGEPQAAEELLPLVYEELRRLAAAKMANEPPGQTLQPTALVHEAWLQLVGENHEWRNRRHFYSVAAEAMRRILVDRARRRRAMKRGGDLQRVPVEELDVAVEAPDEHVLRVTEVLDRLEAEDPLKAKLVKLRFFTGLSIQQASDILGISPTTAKRHWRFARVWLLDALAGSD